MESINQELERISQKMSLIKSNYGRVQSRVIAKMPQMAGTMNVIGRSLEQQVQIGNKFTTTLEALTISYKKNEKVILEKEQTEEVLLMFRSKNRFKTGRVDPYSMTYEEYLEYRYENAVDKNTKKLYKKYMDNVKIKDDSYDGTAHYNGFWNEINYDKEADSNNERGRGCTYYHEVGHLIDDQSDFNSYTSTDCSYKFYDKLEQDVNRWILQIQREQGYTDLNDVYDYMSRWLYEDADNKNGVSDLIKGLTEGQASGRWGHSDSYYSSSSIQKEAFAHFFEAGMSDDPTKLEYIRQIFPTAYEEYQRMLEDELN